MSKDRSASQLGLAPTPEDIDGWFTGAGFRKEKIGASVEGEDLYIYHLSAHHSHSSVSDQDEEDVKAVLFLSLVHGNEPLGLLTLLQTAEQLLVYRQRRLRRHRSLDVIFFPVVNLDAYRLNLKVGSGCQRTNLNPTMCGIAIPLNSTVLESTPKCPELSQFGVDLNRNYPIDWMGGVCGYNFPGTHPFSEPETRAVRKVNSSYNVSAVMSFHSRARKWAPALLIHPYSADRLLSEMDPHDVRRFRSWSQAMNGLPYLYKTGTALEAIQYSAGGTTIDWLYSVNVTAFVHESATPCGQRWCPPEFRNQVLRQAFKYAQAGVKLVELASDDVRSPALSPAVLWLLALIATVACLRRYRSRWTGYFRRCLRKEKDLPSTEAEEERRNLIELH